MYIMLKKKKKHFDMKLSLYVYFVLYLTFIIMFFVILLL